MEARELVDAIAEVRPEYSSADQLRYALLLTLQSEHQDASSDVDEADLPLETQLQELALQLNASCDQHAAVSSELESLAATSPCEFNPQHMWTLVKALKVQTQILNMYLG